MHAHEWISQWNHWLPCDCPDVDKWLECLGCGEMWWDDGTDRWQMIWEQCEAPEPE